MDETQCTSANFMPKDLIEIICILERDEKCHSYKIIRKRKYLTLVTKFPANNRESTPLKNYASGRQTTSQLLIRTRKKFLPKKSHLIESQSAKRTNLQLFLLDPSLLNNILFKIPPM